MSQRALAAISAGCLVLAGASAAGAAAPSPGSTGSTHTPATRLAFPKGAKLAAPAATTTVVLQLKGTPTALAKARSGVARSNALAALAPAQAAVKSSVLALGGKVRYTYSTVLDGVSVTVPTSAVAKLAALPQVAKVLSTSIVKQADVNANNLSQVPSEWSSPGGTGAGETIAVLDTGIDYFHADFGGSGNPSDFANADRTTANSTFPTAKVVGGTDLVGDNYNAAGTGDQLVPHPDPIPLDCTDNESYPHGTHVSGDAAGEGVLSDGSTYTGPYTAAAMASHSFSVYPGSAPDAKLRVYRIFGCPTAENSVSSDVIAAAIDDAVADNVNVINMSLGQTFAQPDDVDSVASENAVTSGIPVVVAAGNAGHFQYATGSPGDVPGVIAVGALDGVPTFTGVGMSTTPNALIGKLDNNSTELPVTGKVKVLRNADGSVSLGCDPSEYTGTAGEIVVALRGNCDRVARAKYGQDAGSAAVVLENTSPGYPPFEGDIPTTSGTGTVAIPFIGVQQSDNAAMTAADGQTITIGAPSQFPSPTYKAPASFTSGGPAPGDSSAKPDVAADGVSVTSAAAGTGTGALTGDGTSFATPVTAGVVADVLQTNPGISANEAKAAVDETADPTQQLYDPRLEGSGVLNAVAATQAKVYETTGNGETSGLSFGYQQLGGAYSASESITFTNESAADATYDLSVSAVGSQLGATESITPEVVVPAGGTAAATMTISLSKAAVAALAGAYGTDASGALAAATLGGTVIATPTSSAGGANPKMSIPYRLVPRGVSRVTPAPTTGYTTSGTTATTSSVISNNGIHQGGSDIYDWQIHDGQDAGTPTETDVIDVGNAVYPGALSGDTEVDFVLDTASKWTQPGNDEFSIGIDTNGDGQDDYFVDSVDCGFILAAAPSGQFCALTTDAHGNALDLFLAYSALNSDAMVLPTDLADYSTGGTFKYHVAATFSQVGLTGESSSYAALNPAHPPVSSGDGGELQPGTSRTADLSVDLAQQQSTPSLGWLVLTLDDANGTGQLNPIPVGTLPSVAPPPALPDASTPVAFLAVGLLTGGAALALRRRSRRGTAA